MFRNELSLALVITSTDPFENLALEEALLQGGGFVGRVALFYANEPCVVMGRNQNPWLELIEPLPEGVKLLRRISGGGTVYHDTGNLLYSFIDDADKLDHRINGRAIVAALQSLELSAVLNDRGDIFIAEYKCSGNARSYQRGKGLHHGTILVNTNLSRLSDCLALHRQAMEGIDKSASPSDRTINGAGISSVPSKVRNLAFYQPEIQMKNVVDAILRQLDPPRVISGAVHEILPHFDPRLVDAFETSRQRLKSSEWVWNQTPPFEMEYRVNADSDAVFFIVGGRVQKLLSKKKGKEANHAVELSGEHIGAVFEADLVARCLEKMKGGT